MAGGVLPSLSLDRASPGRLTPGRLELLSGFALEVGGRTVSLPMGPQRVIALLALQGRPMLREHIAGILWPENSTGHAGASLRSALWRIQRLGLGDLAWTTRSHVGLAGLAVVDVIDVIGQAHRLLGSSEGVRPQDLDYRPLTRDLLPDWYEEWVVAERERFRQLRLHALDALCRRLTVLGMFGTAIQAGLAAVTGEPLRETAQRTLIEAYIAEGNIAEAIRQYSTYRRMLFDDLGVDPSPMMVGLMGRLQGA
jgi:DNA-binding SARP family transcriptional activator